MTSDSVRVLIAEDDRTSRIMLAAMLRKWGYDPKVTEDGAQAWDAYKTSEMPCLVLLDWDMPEMNGIEVCQRIRELPTDQPPYIILLTTMFENEDVVVGLNAGADDYMIKPYNPQELRARIDVGLRIMALQSALCRKVEELQQALDDVKILRGIIPICANCKKIRDDTGYWTQVDVYIHNHSDVDFSHGLCPECMLALYPDIE